MVHTLLQFAQEQSLEIVEAQTWQPDAFKALMVGLSLGLAAVGLALIGSNYMKALGRNPESGKAAGSIIIIAAMVELTALLGFAAAIII